ncbi:hypothetical protein EAF04_002244 [Stromatinia cepivora]|nr:hypothetical protein EAF04_002244 [Stromatinia cepivora]
MDQLPADFFVSSTDFAKTTHIQQYDAVDLTSAGLSQAGKVVIITGANRGLGRKSFVPAFAKANSKAIVLVARDILSLQGLEREIYALNPDVQVLKARADITDLTAVEEVYHKIKNTFGTADLLVNNAGVFTSQNSLANATSKNWWQDFEINVKGTFFITQGFLKLVGPGGPGTIINLATSGSLGTYPNTSSYAMSKLSTVHLQSYVAAENANIAAMSLDPCLAETDMLLDAYKTMQLMEFELIGGAAVWLTTNDARFPSGRLFNVTWDIDELIARKDEIVKKSELVFSFKGSLGKGQFK